MNDATPLITVENVTKVDVWAVRRGTNLMPTKHASSVGLITLNSLIMCPYAINVKEVLFEWENV